MSRGTRSKRFDPYAELDVARDADDEEVRRGYRRRSKRTHPDAGGSDEAFARTSLAQAVLLSPSRRARFDQNGEIEDDPAEQHPDHGAMTMLTGALRVVLADDRPIEQVDVVEFMRKLLRKDQDKTEEALTKMRRARDRTASLVDQFEAKKGAEVNSDLMAALLRGQKSELDIMIAQTEGLCTDRARALELLDGFEFRAKRPDDLVTSIFAIKAGRLHIFGDAGTSTT